jgi:hypothetical protein
MARPCGFPFAAQRSGVSAGPFGESLDHISTGGSRTTSSGVVLLF